MAPSIRPLPPTSFFNDTVVDFGTVSGSLSLDFTLTMTDDPANDGFSTDLIVGTQDIPEPSTWALFVAGTALFLGWKMRRRSKAEDTQASL